MLGAGRWLAGATGLLALAVAGTGAGALVHRDAAVPRAAARSAAVTAQAPAVSPFARLARDLRVPSDPPPRPLAEPALEVAPLTSLTVPDLLVTGTSPLTAAQLAAVQAVPGVTSVVPVAVGAVTIGTGTTAALGVDPSVFRTVTPNVTAASDPLWASVARGDMLVTYAEAKARSLQLGETLQVAGQPVRIGSFADLRMAGVGAVVDAAAGTALGLVPQAGLVVTAPSRDVMGLEHDVLKIVGGSTAAILRPVLPSGGHATMGKALYAAAARTCPGLSWTVLAAIGGIESDHGADTAVSPAGAEGPMQFMPATFAEYAVDADHDGLARIDDPVDAVYTAARMLCLDGAGRGGQSLWNALFAYNHADWYPPEVLSLAARYAQS